MVCDTDSGEKGNMPPFLRLGLVLSRSCIRGCGSLLEMVVCREIERRWDESRRADIGLARLFKVSCYLS
jgi:hypothetical protein